MKRGWLARILILCSLTTVGLTSCYYLAIPARRDPPVAARDLFLHETALPEGWRATDIYTIRPGAGDSEGDEALELEFDGARLPQGRDGAVQTIYRFKNASLAAQAYQRMQNDIFFFPGAYDNNGHPKGWTYRSPIADDWRFAGAPHGYCAIARYDEFISVFSTSMTTPSMTPAALEDVLKAIDQRMGEKLGKIPATPTETTK